ncbi:hypothetical protein BDV19DRAFT_388551 [Aspergillus venezuelensis]
MASGLAPNLTDVYVDYRRPQKTFSAFDKSVSLHRQALVASQPQSPSRLCSLCLIDSEPETIGLWNAGVQLSNLEKLELHVERRTGLLAKAAECSFPSLKSLVLRLSGAERGGDPEDCDRMDENTSVLLAALSSLEQLLICGYVTVRSTQTAISCHGQTLHKLGLLYRNNGHPWCSFITPELLDDIHAHCPKLCSLALRISQSQGDAVEKKILINLAIDKTLVRSIFDVITTPSTKNESLFESLRVGAKLEDYIPAANGSKRVVSCRIWEAFEHESLKDRHYSFYLDGRKLPYWIEQGHGEKLFRKLWPKTKRRSSWVDDWRSFPLQLD